jgi:hypothetical protein
MSRQIFFPLALIVLLVGCHKQLKQLPNQPASCIQVAQNASWTTEAFKNNGANVNPPLYSIQFPSGYMGYGFTWGFEGMTFDKIRNDNTVRFSSFYPTGLLMLMWGKNLPTPEPDFITINSALSSGQNVFLNKKIKFCETNNSEIGIYYYNDSYAYGRLFWKDNGTFKEALDVVYNFPRQQEVLDIIKTIHKN